MIELFEEYTHDLTDYEKKEILPFLLEILPFANGKSNIIKNEQILSRLRNVGKKSSQPRIRHILHCIRVSGMIPCLMASSGGYYVSNDLGELGLYLQSLDDRIHHITAVRHALAEQMARLREKKERHIFQPTINFT